MTGAAITSGTKYLLEDSRTVTSGTASRPSFRSIAPKINSRSPWKAVGMAFGYSAPSRYSQVGLPVNRRYSSTGMRAAVLMTIFYRQNWGRTKASAVLGGRPQPQYLVDLAAAALTQSRT